MKVLIAIYDYFPNNSANSICMKFIIEKMLLEDIEVHVVCVKSDNNSNDDEILYGVNIHRVELLEDSINRRVRQSNNLLFKLLSKISKKYYEITTLHGNCGYTKSFNSNAVFEKVKSLINTNQINTMISVSYPFTTHLLLNKVKNVYPYIRWICYELDPFTYNFTLPKNQVYKRKKLELSTFEKADLIISTKGINEFNDLKEYRGIYNYKTISLPLPGLIFNKDFNKSVSILKKNFGRVNLIYTGQFYGDLRSPYPLMALLNDERSVNIDFHVIGGTVDGKYKNVKANIIEYPRSTMEICDIAIQNSDIAINFDNKIPNQAPSKLLTYMSNRIPIINFYYKDCTVGELYLKDYFPHLSICIDDIACSEVIDSFYNFINNYIKFDREKMLKDRNTFYLSNEVISKKFIDSIR